MDSIFTWGRQAEHQCGRKDEVGLLTWPKKLPSDVHWRTVSCKFNRSAAISGARKATVALACGQQAHLFPIQSPPFAPTLSPFFLYLLTLLADGQMYTWGTGHMGELGLAYLEKTEQPTKVVKVPPHTNWAQVACGKEHTLSLTDGGIMYAWGANELGQLGLGHTKPVDRPTRIHKPDVKYSPCPFSRP